MALVTRARIAGILGVCLLMLSAPGALAIELVLQPDAQVRAGNGTYVGDDLYFPPWIQGVSRSGVVDQKFTFFILMENDSTWLDQFTVKRSGFFNPGFRVRYYDADDNDVTGQVNAGTFTTPQLDPLGAEDYVMRATVKIRPQATACSGPLQRTITVTSSNGLFSDQVIFGANLLGC